jgi:hypothetical protein
MDSPERSSDPDQQLVPQESFKHGLLETVLGRQLQWKNLKDLYTEPKV